MTNLNGASHSATITHKAPLGVTEIVEIVGVDFNAVFDRKMLHRMKHAVSIEKWTELRDILLRAHKHNNLRADVFMRFCEECPYPTMTQQFAAGLYAVRTQS